MRGPIASRLAATIVLALTASAIAQWRHLDALTSHEQKGPALELHCGEASVRLEATRDHVMRVRLAPDGHFARDFSWAVENLKPTATVSTTAENEDRLEINSGALRVAIQKQPCRLTILDAEGRVLIEDDLARGMAWCAGVRRGDLAVRAWQTLSADAGVYGLGEKTGPLNKAGRAWTMWNTDAWSYAPSRDPIYQSIPFFIQANKEACHGVFFDNPWRTSFDFGSEDRNIVSFGAEGGELNYYVIAGPSPKDVVSRYTELTGRIELPPKWALGYHQSRYSYSPESRVRDVAKQFEERRMPCDVIYFDIDYMEGFRCFTWDKRRFPNARKLTDDLKAQGIRTVAIIDPGIKQEPGYSVFDGGAKLDAWLKMPGGEPYVGRVWAGASVFPDFTNPRVRDWWAGLVHSFVEACGIDGIWNDMNEPADFEGPDHSVPLDLIHDNEGMPASHRACHNVYGMQMHRATHEGLQRAQPKERVFTLTRASYAGGQRFGASWTGDNVSNWEHLRMSVAMNLGLGLSGMPFTGPDIGGFAGGARPELYARWIQLASLFPYCRTHTSWDNPDQEPWSFGDRVERIARESLLRRYRFLPYIYTLFEEAARTGLPVLRPVWMEFPGYHHSEDEAFMLGPSVFVAPTLQPDARERFIDLPPGVWFDAESGEVHASGQPVRISPELEHLPLFILAGSAIPMQSPVLNTTETPVDSLIVDVWPTPSGEFSGCLYEDDGLSLSYQHGIARRTTFTGNRKESKLELIMKSEGPFTPPGRRPLIRFHGIRGEICSATVAHCAETRSCNYRRDGDAWLVRLLDDDGHEQRATIEWKPLKHEAEAFRLSFDKPGYDIPCMREMTWSRENRSKAAMIVRSEIGPHFILRRVQIHADSLRFMRLRLSTQHTKAISMRFASEEEPTLSDQSFVTIDTIPDGTLREYTIDLKQASGGKWKGHVYWLRFDLVSGVKSDESIRLEDMAFLPNK
jgi:alpha-glucosidase